MIAPMAVDSALLNYTASLHAASVLGAAIVDDLANTRLALDRPRAGHEPEAAALARQTEAARALETRVDAWGCLELRLPLDVFEAELVYSEGPLEWASLLLSALALALWVVWARRPPPAGGAARSPARAGPRRAA